MIAFDQSLDRLFLDPNLASDALWRIGGTGDGVPVRVIRKSPDKIVGFGDSRAVMSSVLIDVRQSEVDLPATGDRNADIAALTQAMNDHIERWVRANPEQWLWLHRRFPREVVPT